jgi:hypothetical protein
MSNVRSQKSGVRTQKLKVRSPESLKPLIKKTEAAENSLSGISALSGSIPRRSESLKKLRKPEATEKTNQWPQFLSVLQ